MPICNQFLSPSFLLFVPLDFGDFQLIKTGSLFFYQPACAYGLERLRHQKKKKKKTWLGFGKDHILVQNNGFCCHKHVLKCADVRC